LLRLALGRWPDRSCLVLSLVCLPGFAGSNWGSDDVIGTCFSAGSTRQPHEHRN